MQTQQHTVPRFCYSMAEIEIATSLSRATLYRAIASGQLKTVKRGKRRLVPAQALEDFLQPSETRQ